MTDGQLIKDLMGQVGTLKSQLAARDAAIATLETQLADATRKGEQLCHALGSSAIACSCGAFSKNVASEAKRVTDRLAARDAAIVRLKDQVRYRASRDADFLASEGYRRCDIAACNCDSWHDHRRHALIESQREEIERLKATLARFENMDENWVRCEGCQRWTEPKDMREDPEGGGGFACLWCAKLDATKLVVDAVVAWYHQQNEMADPLLILLATRVAEHLQEGETK